MSGSTRIAVVSSSPLARAELALWLEDGGFRAVPVSALISLGRDLTILPCDLLIVDTGTRLDWDLLYRALRRGSLPVIVIGERNEATRADAERRGATYLERPFDDARLLFTVAVALTEGRPLRRSPRRAVQGFEATIDGAVSRLVDVSQEGVRLEVPAAQPQSLPEFFRLQVPTLDVSVVVQRVWVSRPREAAGALWCGGALGLNTLTSAARWRALVDSSPERPAAP